MKYVLIMIICSNLEATCFSPLQLDQKFHTPYDCLVAGYTESKNLTIELGEEQVNKNKIIIKFTCQASEEGVI